MTDLQYRFVIGLLVPIALAVVGIVAKKISRGIRGGWRRSDFYLGREFSLAGVATAVTSILIVLLKPSRVFQGKADLLNLGENFTTVLVGFILYMLIVGMHQDYEDESHTGQDRTRELKWILCVSNLIGIGLLVASVALMVD